MRRSGQSVLPDPPLVQRVRRAIRDALPHDAPKVADVAKALGLGPRTLHRRLAAEGTSFGEVLDSTRHRVAVGEVAYLVGFREQSSFFRAFKRWTGETPTRYGARSGLR